jgi:glycosyltransferase involved in cell wall biosynthesis
MSTAPTIRIYSPFPPFDRSEGSYHVIADQAHSLKRLGFQVEMIHWKDAGQIENKIQRSTRVLKSLLTDLASPEEFYYPTVLDPGDQLTSIADIGIYHYSFSYNWLHKNPNRPEKKKFVHFHNLESDLFEMRAKEQSSASYFRNWIHLRNARKLRRHELTLPKLADELWFVSTVDLENFLNRARSLEPSPQYSPQTEPETRLVPPSFDPQVFRRRSQLFRNSASSELCLGILGRFDFGPNRASLAWLIDELAPRLQAGQFKGRILVCGKHVPEDLIQKGQSFGFFDFLGFVPDLEDFWSHLSFLLIPQLGGSGVRIKLLEALSSGLPVIANPEATLPLSPKIQASPLISSYASPQDWADRILQEKPFATRQKLGKNNLSADLDGVNIYRFLVKP